MGAGAGGGPALDPPPPRRSLPQNLPGGRILELRPSCINLGFGSGGGSMVSMVACYNRALVTRDGVAPRMSPGSRGRRAGGRASASRSRATVESALESHAVTLSRATIGAF